MNRKKELTIIACILLFCFFSLFVVAGILISRPSFQQKLLRKISEKVGYEIRAKCIKISLRHGIGIKIEQLDIQPKQGEFIFSCPTLFFNYKISKLIKGRLIPETVVLDRPIIEIEKESFSSAEKEGFSKEKLLFLFTNIPSTYIKDADISVKPFSISARSVNLCVKKLSNKAISLDLKSKVYFKETSFPLNTKGRLYISEDGDLKVKFETELKGFPLSCIREKDIVIFSDGTASGRFYLSGSFQKSIKVSGKIRLNKPNFLLIGTDSQKKTYKFSYLKIQFTGNVKEKKFLFQPVIISAEGLKLDINAKLSLNQKSPLIFLKVSSPEMEMAMFKKVFPSCLLPDWLENRLFPIIKKGKLKKIRFSLAGTVDQLEHLDNPANRSVLSGSLLMDKLLLMPKGAGAPLRNIKGKLILKDGNLLIKEISAELSSSKIKKATLLIKDIYYDSRHYCLFLKGKFNLKDLMSQLHMEFTPQVILKTVKGLKEISGIMDTTVACEYEESWKMPIFNNSSAHFLNTRIAYNKLPQTLLIKEGSFWIDATGNYHFSGTTRLGSSTLYVMADVDQHLKHIKVNVSGDVRPDRFWRKYLGKNIVIKGPLKIKIKASNQKDLWDISGRVSSKRRVPLYFYSAALTPYPFCIKFSLRYSPNKVLIKSFNFRSKKSRLYAWAVINKKKMKMKIKTQKLYLEDLGIRYANMISSIKGLINANLKIEYEFSNPINTHLYGTVRAKHLFVQKDLIKDCSMKLGFFGKKVSIYSLKANIEKYPLHVKGYLKGWEGLKGKLYVKLDYLDLDKLRALKHKTKEKKSPNKFLKDSDLYVHVETKKAVCKDIVFKPIIGEFFLRNGDISIKKLLANMDYGKLTVDGIPEKRWTDYRLHLTLKNMPLERIFSCLKIKKYIDGKITAEAMIHTKAEHMNQLIPHMNGKLKVSITDGKIYKAQPVLKILDFFSLANIWKFNPLSVFEEGVPFDFIKIKASIKEGVVSSDKMILESKALNAAGKGRLDLNKKWIDLGIAIQPLGTIDSIISKLPIVGYIIAGKDKKITLYYFEVKGPLSNVEVVQKPIKNLINGTLNIFKRILLTPAHIFEDIGG